MINVVVFMFILFCLIFYCIRARRINEERAAMQVVATHNDSISNGQFEPYNNAPLHHVYPRGYGNSTVIYLQDNNPNNYGNYGPINYGIANYGIPSQKPPPYLQQGPIN